MSAVSGRFAASLSGRIDRLRSPIPDEVPMSKEELGTKRVDPETGQKFYDLGKDPIVSPYTGKSYPLSFFETVKATRASRAAPAPEVETEEEEEVVEVVETDEETVSLTEVEDDEEAGAKTELPGVDGDEDDDVADDDADDTFLPDDEDEDDDMTDIIGGGRDEDDDV